MSDNIRQFLEPRPQRRVLQLVMLRDPLNALVSLYYWNNQKYPDRLHRPPNPLRAVKFFEKNAGSYLQYWAPDSYPGNACDRCVRAPRAASTGVSYSRPVAADELG
jgi:hypothetical protein